MEIADYPRPYQESDACSIRNQGSHFVLVGGKVALLLIVSTCSAFYLGAQVEVRQVFAMLIAVSLVAILACGVIESRKRFDHVWFSCRAIAESIKSETWRFMMKVEPPIPIDDLEICQKCKQLPEMLESITREAEKKADQKARTGFVRQMRDSFDDVPRPTKMTFSNSRNLV